MGLTLARIVDAGKNQGLAGGAIILGYGIISAVIGLIAALFVSNRANRKIIFRINIVLVAYIVAFCAYFYFGI